MYPRESLTNEDNDDYFETLSVNYEVIPEYDHNYPPLVKWMKDHPKTQVIGNPSTDILTFAQKKEMQDLLNINQDYCMLHSFTSKIEPTTMKITLDQRVGSS